MCNKELLVGYLYGELTADDRAAFEAHAAECADCRLEVQGLRQTRQHLASWAPPEPDLDFTIVRGARAGVASRPRLFAFVPQWGLAAAAALLVLAGAAAIANVEVRYGQDGTVVVRTGWSAPAEPAVAGTPPRAAVEAVRTSKPAEDLGALVTALARRVSALESSPPAPVRVAASGGISVPELRRILAEYEARQRTEMAVQVAQVWRDWTAARANDVAYFQKTLGQAQGLTNQQLRQHRDSIESLYRVSVSQIQR
jgi:anti-sigma factor RsiW